MHREGETSGENGYEFVREKTNPAGLREKINTFRVAGILVKTL